MDGNGVIFLLFLMAIVVIVAIAIDNKKEHVIRCQRCGYRGYLSDYVHGRCPSCQSLEIDLRR